MNNFDEAVKEYLIKHVDPQNPQIVTYEFKRRPRVETFSNGKRNRLGGNGLGIKINTPKGVFNSLASAAQAFGVSKQTMSTWIRRRQEDFKEIE